jgi:hypothetical protein
MPFSFGLNVRIAGFLRSLSSVADLRGFIDYAAEWTVAERAV